MPSSQTIGRLSEAAGGEEDVSEEEGLPDCGLSPPQAASSRTAKKRAVFDFIIKSLFDKGSLKEIAYVLDCQTENTIDGSELPALWKTDPAKVVEKNKSDLIQTEKIYERVKEWIPQRLQMFSSSKKDIIG